jgi:hypothetical protein
LPGVHFKKSQEIEFNSSPDREKQIAVADKRDDKGYFQKQKPE